MSNFIDAMKSLPFPPVALDSTLVYYDGPRLGVLSTVDENIFYLFSSIEEAERELFAFLLVQLSSERLALVLDGSIDLHSAFRKASVGETFRMVQPDGEDDDVVITSVAPAEIDESDLARPGYSLTQDETL